MAATIIYWPATHWTRSAFTCFLGLSLIFPAFCELGIIFSVKSGTFRNLPRIMQLGSKRAKTQSEVSLSLLLSVTLYCSPPPDYPWPPNLQTQPSDGSVQEPELRAKNDPGRNCEQYCFWNPPASHTIYASYLFFFFYFPFLRFF